MTKTTLITLEARINEMQETITNQNDLLNKLANRIIELENQIDDIELKSAPKFSTPSSRSMTELDAFRVLHGDMKDMKARQCAEKLGLSMGQIYSARGSYTFKTVTETRVELRNEMEKLLAQENEDLNTETYIELPPAEGVIDALVEEFDENISTAEVDVEEINS